MKEDQNKMQAATGPLFLNDAWFLIKLGYLIFTILYFIFSLIVVRQVNLMTETVITEAAGLLKVLAILNALLALGLVVYFIYTL